MQIHSIAVEVQPGIQVPLALIKPAVAGAPAPVVVGISHGGKDDFWREHRTEIERLIGRGIAVCLLDVRGTGETSPDGRRGPMSAEVSLAATELMLGGSLLAGRIKDVRSVLAYLRTRPDIDRNRIALWGDSDTPANPPRLLLDESPGWQIGPDVQLEADPLGGLLALFAALYEPGVRVAAMRRGIVAFESMLEDTFAYVPGHVIVPDMLSAGDLPDIVGAMPSTALWMESLIDARNRVLPQSELRARFPSDTKAALRAAAPKSALADWLIAKLSELQ